MEKITNIEIKNFKSIRHQKIDGCKRINVFVGYPNVGKSNILEALGIFCVEKDTENIFPLIRIDNTPSLFFNGNIENNFDITVDDIHKLLGVYDVQDDSILINRLYGYGDFAKAKNGLKQNSTYKIDNKKIVNYVNPSIGKTTYPHEIRAFKKYEFKKNVEVSSGKSLSLKQPYGENIFDVLSSNDLIRGEAREIFGKYNLKFALDKGTRVFKILKDVGDDFFLISYSMIADTIQRLIFYKAAILSNRNCVLLFEEPEAHMFPPYIKELTSDIIFDKNDNQYFIATHSPFVLNELIEEAQEELSVYVVDYDKGETIIKRLTDEEVTEISQYGIDLFFNLESYLEKNGQPHSA